MPRSSTPIDLPKARSLLSFDSAAARERIERLPWVATASIARIFPGTLDVRVTERAPAAVWQRGGHAYLIDAEGRTLSEVQPGANPSLPRVAGEGAAAQAKALFDLVVRFPRIRERFEMAERMGERRWTLHLKDGADRASGRRSRGGSLRGAVVARRPRQAAVRP